MFFLLIWGYISTHGNSDNKKILFQLASAKLIQSVAWLLLVLRSLIPDILSVNLGNSLLFFGYFIESIIILHILKYKNKGILNFQFYLCLFNIAVFNILSFFFINANLRVAIASLATSFILSAPTVLLLIEYGQNSFRRLLGIVYLIFFLVLLLRGVNGFLDRSEYLFSASLIQKLTFLIAFLLLITSGTGLLLLIHEEKENKIKKLLQDKDKFLSIIAHDLKNPFQALIGYSEMIKMHLSNDNKQKAEENCNVIYNTAKLTYKLLDNLLNWALIQQGNMDYSPSAININSVVGYNVEQLAPVAFTKQIEISQVFDQDYIVFADKNFIDTIIRNLITNAIKFSHPGSTIEVKLSTIPQFVVVSVSDKGVGMEPEVLSSLFNVESLKSQLGTTGEKGTGLGLKLCKEFVEMQGGIIKVESILGEGSKFIFTVPIYKPKEN